MRWLAVAAASLLLAGCGGGNSKAEQPEVALLTDVQVEGDRARFEFESPPQQVRTRFVPRSQVAECGSGADVPLEGKAFLLVNFTPARTAEIDGEKVVPTYTGPKRLEADGPLLEAVKVCDFEADVGWAIGLEQRIQPDVSTDGSTVTIGFE